MTADHPAPKTASACPFSLHGPELAEDPALVYSRLREHGPVAPVEPAPGITATLVTGYEAALEVLRDPATFPKDPRKWQDTLPADQPVPLLMRYRPDFRHADGTAHSRVREAVTDSLARMDLYALRRHIESSADTLIARFSAKGSCDLVADYARILPVLVFNELFGAPPEISERLTGSLDTEDAERSSEMRRQAVEELVALKRKDPGRDVTSWLAAHPVRLTDEELAHQILALVGAGTEPTRNLIANGLRLLLSDERFAGDLSGGSLQVEDAIDEILWTDPPLANFAATYPTRAVEFAGVRLPKDQPVLISLAAANTDPAMATDHREGNRAHLAWGAGPHTCPAQGHARLIASVAIEKILDALPEMELAVPAALLTWRPDAFHRALKALPVTFPPATATFALPQVDAWHAPSRPPTEETEPVPPDLVTALLSDGTPPPRRRGAAARWLRRR